MSQAQFDAFFDKMMGDKGLRAKMADIKYDERGSFAKVAAIAQAVGFDVTAVDVQEANLSTKDGALSDADLDMVAGAGRDCHKVCDSICGEFLGHWMGRQ